VAGKSGAPTAIALLVVGRVLSETAGADGLPVRRAAGDHRALAAAAADLELVLVVAAAAAALLTAPVTQPRRTAAGRAGRGEDAGGTGGQQGIDERDDAWRAVGTLAGEQPGLPVQLPQHLMPLGRPRHRLVDQPGHCLMFQPWVDASDVSCDLRDGIGCAIRKAPRAAWAAVLVTCGDLTGVPADRAGLGGTAPGTVAR
jgi:hypothetical protein